MANMQLVTMKHSDIEHGDNALPVTTMQAFEDVWAAKGWELVDAATLVAETLDEKTVPQLRKLAKDQGIEVAGNATKPDLIAALTAAGSEG